MITGRVTAGREAVVLLEIRGITGEVPQVSAVIDTGFTGFLTLPPALIEELGLPRIGRGRALLANGAEDIFDIYAGSVIWHGTEREVEVDAADTAPLLGMALLDGSELRIQAVIGGVVAIKSLS